MESITVSEIITLGMSQMPNLEQYSMIRAKNISEVYKLMLHQFDCVEYAPNPLRFACANHLIVYAKDESVNYLTYQEHVETFLDSINAGTTVFQMFSIHDVSTGNASGPNFSPDMLSLMHVRSINAMKYTQESLTDLAQSSAMNPSNGVTTMNRTPASSKQKSQIPTRYETANVYRGATGTSSQTKTKSQLQQHARQSAVRNADDMVIERTPTGVSQKVRQRSASVSDDQELIRQRVQQKLKEIGAQQQSQTLTREALSANLQLSTQAKQRAKTAAAAAASAQQFERGATSSSVQLKQQQRAKAQQQAKTRTNAKVAVKARAKAVKDLNAILDDVKPQNTTRPGLSAADDDTKLDENATSAVRALSTMTLIQQIKSMITVLESRIPELEQQAKEELALVSDETIHRTIIPVINDIRADDTSSDVVTELSADDLMPAEMPAEDEITRGTTGNFLFDAASGLKKASSKVVKKLLLDRLNMGDDDESDEDAAEEADYETRLAIKQAKRQAERAKQLKQQQQAMKQAKLQQATRQVKPSKQKQMVEYEDDDDE
jgi:hypothetical protein